MGYSQREGENYSEIFSPVAKMSTIRMALAVSANERLHVHQMDVVNAFLNAELEEEIWMEIPEGMEDADIDSPTEDHVLKLLKSLYVLKQAPRNWNQNINTFLIEELGFTRCVSDNCCYCARS